MVPWLIFAAVAAVVGALLTLAWWRVGDQWADEEHRRFRDADKDPDAGAQVIRGFGASEQPKSDSGQP